MDFAVKKQGLKKCTLCWNPSRSKSLESSSAAVVPVDAPACLSGPTDVIHQSLMIRGWVSVARVKEVKGKALLETYKVQATVVSSGANWHQSVPQDHLTGDMEQHHDTTRFPAGTSKIRASMATDHYQLISFSCRKLEMLNLRDLRVMIEHEVLYVVLMFLKITSKMEYGSPILCVFEVGSLVDTSFSFTSSSTCEMNTNILRATRVTAHKDKQNRTAPKRALIVQIQSDKTRIRQFTGNWNWDRFGFQTCTAAGRGPRGVRLFTDHTVDCFKWQYVTWPGTVFKSRWFKGKNNSSKNEWKWNEGFRGEHDSIRLSINITRKCSLLTN